MGRRTEGQVVVWMDEWMVRWADGQMDMWMCREVEWMDSWMDRWVEGGREQRREGNILQKREG